MRMDIGNRLAGVGVLVGALAASGCAAGQSAEEQAPDPKEWFAQECPAQTAQVREADPSTQEPTGAVVGTALVQGAIRAPAGLESSAESIRYLRLDEMSHDLVPLGEMAAGEVVCFEQDLRLPERRLDADTPVRGEAWDGGEHFTRVRTPEHPQGVWIDWKFSGVKTAPGGFMVGEDTAACAEEWSAAVDITPLEEGATNQESIIPLNVATAEDC